MLLFAHRGGRAHAPDNTLLAFRLALDLGATALESDVRLTADGVPVLAHDGVLRRGMRRQSVAATRRADLPSEVPSLAELYAEVGPDVPLSLDVKDPTAAGPTVDVARSVGASAALWLCGDLDALAGWRRLDRDIHLVDSTRRRQVREGFSARARTLKALGASALNLPAGDWDPQRVREVQREGVLAFGWDAHTPSAVRRLRALGVDAIYGDDVGALLTA